MNNKEVVRRQLDQVYNHGNYDVLDKHLSPTATLHEMNTAHVGVESIKQFARNLRTAFPDLRMEVEHIIEEDDWVALTWKASGTHRGNMFGIAPTGKFATVTGQSMYKLDDQRITEAWVQWDVLTMLREMNVELPIKLDVEVPA